jgi:hypothetical protein
MWPTTLAIIGQYYKNLKNKTATKTEEEASPLQYYSHLK